MDERKVASLESLIEDVVSKAVLEAGQVELHDRPFSERVKARATIAHEACDTILAALRATGEGRSEAAGKSGLSNAELEAEALRYQAIAAEQGSTIMRLRIAMKLLTESGHGGAIHTARKWFASGGTGPIPWPGGACFAAWAEEQGYSEVDGYIGFRMTARLLLAQTAGGAGE